MTVKQPLCRTCRHFEHSNVGGVKITLQGNINFSEYNRCGAYGLNIIREATDCRDYDDRRVPKLDDMNKAGWILETKRVIGYEKPVVQFIEPEKR